MVVDEVGGDRSGGSGGARALQDRPRLGAYASPRGRRGTHQVAPPTARRAGMSRHRASRARLRSGVADVDRRLCVSSPGERVRSASCAPGCRPGTPRVVPGSPSTRPALARRRATTRRRLQRRRTAVPRPRVVPATARLPSATCRRPTPPRRGSRSATPARRPPPRRRRAAGARRASRPCSGPGGSRRAARRPGHAWPSGSALRLQCCSSRASRY